MILVNTNLEAKGLGMNIWIAKKTIMLFADARLKRLDLAMKMRETVVKGNLILIVTLFSEFYFGHIQGARYSYEVET